MPVQTPVCCASMWDNLTSQNDAVKDLKSGAGWAFTSNAAEKKPSKTE